MRSTWKRWLLAAAVTVVAATAVGLQVVGGSSGQALAGTKTAAGAATGLGPLSGALPREKLTLESAIQVDLSKETVRLPLYQGHGGRQDGLVRPARRVRRRRCARPGCQLRAQARQPRHRLPRLRADGDARVADPGRESVRPGGRRTSRARRTSARRGSPQPGPGGFPLAQRPARRGRGPGLQPVHPHRRIADRLQRADRRDRRRAVRRRAPHEHARSRARRPHRRAVASGPVPRVLGRHAVRQGLRRRPADRLPRTDAGQPLTAVLERSTYVPALDKAAYNGGDDFLGSARERLFGFVNGQTGADNKRGAGLRAPRQGRPRRRRRQRRQHRADRCAPQRRGPAERVRRFPDLKDPRHAEAYSPLWDAQLGQWTQKAIKQGLDKRQIDEDVVFNLAATRPDLITGPGGRALRRGGRRHQLRRDRLHEKAPTKNLEEPVPNSQFPPR